jgi:hypothetical protein
VAEDTPKEEELREVYASEILDKIQKGEDIELDGYNIKGDLDLSQLDLQEDEKDRRIVAPSISMKNCGFYGELYFSHSNFKKTIDFSESHFEGDASFSGCHFEKDVNFGGSHFEGDVYFLRSHFEGDGDFRRSHFEGEAYFTDARFEGNGDFMRSHFKEEAYFMRSHFEGDASFNESHFEGDAYFMRSHFERDADFSRSQFDKMISFASTGKDRTICGKSLNLDNCKIYSMYIDADFSDPSQRQISLRYPDLNHLFVRWESIKDHIQFDGSAYLALVKNFNNLELFNDADRCYYQYRTVRRKEHLEGIIPKLLDYVAWIAYGYGVRPGNPLILSLGLFLISIFIFLLGFGLQEPLGSMINATYLSVFVFTSSPKTDPLTGLYGIWGMIERIAGWLLMACFLVVLAKKTIR